MTLREFRLDKGWTLLALGERIGCKPSTVSRIERGINRPSEAIANNIRRVTRNAVTFEDLWTLPRTEAQKRGTNRPVTKLQKRKEK